MCGFIMTYIDYINKSILSGTVYRVQLTGIKSNHLYYNYFIKHAPYIPMIGDKSDYSLPVV